MLPLLRLLRYRFFLSAGLLPYFLGAAIAYHVKGSGDLASLLLGLLGLALAFAGVEAFNEYFDPADRVLQSEGAGPSLLTFWFGAACFGAALPIALYLTVARGPWVILLASLGFLIAASYVGPPLRLAYRGLGEMAIFLAYGPLIILGSYYIQALTVDRTVVLASLIPGALILALAILNEIPDYYQDLLTGKRNMVVRLGRKGGAALYGGVLLAAYAVAVAVVFGGSLPQLSLLILFTLPLALWSIALVRRHYDEPQRLLPAVNMAAILYVAVNAWLVLSYTVS